MAKGKGVSGKNHTQEQLNDYTNQNNPNNKAYKARVANENKIAAWKKKSKHRNYVDNSCAADLEWFCYSNPYDFD